MVKRRERQDASDGADNVVRGGGFKIRAVAAIVKNNKSPHEDGAGQHGERNGEPPGDRHGKIHQHPAAQVGHQGIDDLPDGARDGGLLVARDDGWRTGARLLGDAGIAAWAWVFVKRTLYAIVSRRLL